MRRHIPAIIFILAIAAITTVPVLTALLKNRENHTGQNDNFSAVTGAAIQENVQEPLALEGKRIVVDAGHGSGNLRKVTKDK